ncbi:MAG: 50S ribosomal protein L11 methyltransferase [Sphingomonas sp.]|nr:50S ribosomal protein L11 methyltransferase [Sphingomonas sp.]
MADIPHNSLFDHPGHLLELGRRLISAGEGAKALALARQACAARPNDPLIASVAGAIMRFKVAPFHRSMLRDRARNADYRRAIDAVARGRVVLDIGTGSGLLAMMAARAGAAHVYACESEPMLAATAREIVAANGFADRITVFAKHSRELDRVRDLGGGVDLVISEIFGQELLNEGVLPSLEHARAELCAPGAAFLPEAAALRVALYDIGTGADRLGDVEGFDLSEFDKHLKGIRIAELAMLGAMPRSAAADLFLFDFRQAVAMEGRARAELVSTGGRVTGLGQWLRLDFVPGISHENDPMVAERSSWASAYVPFDAPRETAPGARIAIEGWHGEDRVFFWTAR